MGRIKKAPLLQACLRLRTSQDNRDQSHRLPGPEAPLTGDSCLPRERRKEESRSESLVTAQPISEGPTGHRNMRWQTWGLESGRRDGKGPSLLPCLVLSCPAPAALRTQRSADSRGRECWGLFGSRPLAAWVSASCLSSSNSESTMARHCTASCCEASVPGRQPSWEGLSCQSAQC